MPNDTPNLTNEEVKAGYVLVSQRDVDDMFGAARELGKKVLPDGPAYSHIAKCIAALRPHVLEAQDARQMASNAHMPNIESATDGEEVEIVNPLGLHKELHAINTALCKVTLPGKITAEMLPKKLKSRDDNEAGVGAALGVLSPLLYSLDGDD